MSEFDLDKYLKENNTESNKSLDTQKSKFDSKDFDIDSYLKANPQPIQEEYKPEKNWYDMPTLSGIKEAAIENLPAEGAMVGGLLGTPLDIVSGPAGTVGGAALGGMAGAGLKGMIDRYRAGGSDSLTESPTLEGMKQATGELVSGAVSGAGQELGGQLLGKAIPAISSGLKKGASRLIEDSAGIPIQKTIPKIFDESTGRSLKQYGETTGIGANALEEGAVPMTGGPAVGASKAQEAITENFQELKPLLQKTQSKIDVNLNDNLKQVGHIEDKISNVVDDFIEKNDLDSSYVNDVKDIFGKYIENARKFDGNIPALNEIKKDLYKKTVALNKNMYQATDKVKASHDAQLGADLARIVKTQIEDLASTVDPAASQQIQTVNSKISKLITYQQYLDKLIGKPSTSISGKDLAQKGIGTGIGFLAGGTPGAVIGTGAQYIAEKALGQTLGSTGEKVLAKTMYGTGKLMDKAPVNQLVQKIVPASFNKTPSNPFSEKSVSSGKFNEATTKASRLYNATNESLKSFSEKIKQEPSLSHAAEELQKAIDLKDEQRKNNAIFLLLQKDAINKYLKE